eukprot:TRINITY_DN2024_c0_g1_i1.p3 TRINITY_DN2024_c0_g1~~TRINITY_DN2024_c0_g1_i1.p3  ORF type:complete len:129 (+),score=54.59 TRINITY_DN2024_c0_g1_i1:45-389(+)
MAETIRCQHLLIKHSGSRNPVSRRTGRSTAEVSKADAETELKEYLARAKGEEDFGQLCKARSDCGSFATFGDLGNFKKGDMQLPFEEAAFALQVGSISDVVDSDSGLHIIKRVA